MKKTIIKTSLNTSNSRSSLPQVGCVRGANTFPNHNQSLTRESLTRPVHPVFLVAFNKLLGGDSNEPNQIKHNNEKSLADAARIFRRATHMMIEYVVSVEFTL